MSTLFEHAWLTDVLSSEARRSRTLLWIRPFIEGLPSSPWNCCKGFLQSQVQRVMQGDFEGETVTSSGGILDGGGFHSPSLS